MGSSTGAKWFVVILAYFFIMAFVVTLIDDVSSVSITPTGEQYLGCGLPRQIYEPYSPYPVDISDESYSVTKYYQGQFECENSVGVKSPTICGNLTGCTWDEPGNWFEQLFNDFANTCVGMMDYDNITDDSQYYAGGFIIDPHENGDDICTHPNVIGNETMCDVFSCTWKQHGGIDDIALDDVQPSLGLIGSTWNTVSEMFTFRFSFGIDDEATNNMVNFLVFWLPLLGLILSLYVMVRS